jgi:hypothetical protein
MSLISIIAILIAASLLASCASSTGRPKVQISQNRERFTQKGTPTQEQRVYAAQTAASIPFQHSSVPENLSEEEPRASSEAEATAPVPPQSSNVPKNLSEEASRVRSAAQATAPAQPPFSGIAGGTSEREARATYTPQTTVSATPQSSRGPTRPSKASTHVTQSTQVEKVIGSKPVIGDDSELRD